CREQLFGNSKTLFAQTGDLVSQCARAYTEFFSRILATAPLLTQGIHDDFVFPLLEIIAQLSAAWPRILGIGDHDVLRIEVGNTDRKSTRLNSSHVNSSYAVFCWKQKR